MMRCARWTMTVNDIRRCFKLHITFKVYSHLTITFIHHTQSIEQENLTMLCALNTLNAALNFFPSHRKVCHKLFIFWHYLYSRFCDYYCIYLPWYLFLHLWCHDCSYIFLIRRYSLWYQYYTSEFFAHCSQFGYIGSHITAFGGESIESSRGSYYSHYFQSFIICIGSGVIPVHSFFDKGCYTHQFLSVFKCFSLILYWLI